MKKQKTKTILGIDPGTATTGFGVIKARKNELEFVECGVFRTKASTPLPKRLKEIEKDLKEVIEKHRPEEIAVEELFFAKNVKTAISVGHARGVVLLVAEHSKKKIFEYTPLQVKQAVTGYGKADKRQVQQMVKQLLCLNKAPRPDDAADALAVAICQAQTR